MRILKRRAAVLSLATVTRSANMAASADVTTKCCQEQRGGVKVGAGREVCPLTIPVHLVTRVVTSLHGSIIMPIHINRLPSRGTLATSRQTY